MEADRFERAVRLLTTSPSRRHVLGGLISLCLGGVLGRDLPGAQAKGKKSKGGKAKKGKKKKNDVCTKAAAACAGGKCGLGQPCCSDLQCDSCKSLYCVGGGGGRPGVCGCDDTDVLHNGRCGTKPTCLSAGERREFYDIRCCSGSQHTEGPEEAPYDVCDPGVLSCLADSDCTGGKCRGFLCYGLEVDCPPY